MSSGFVYLPGAELDFHKSPAPVCQGYDGIGLEPCFVAVVEDFSAEWLDVYAQVAHAYRLKQQAECLKVAKQLFGVWTYLIP